MEMEKGGQGSLDDICLEFRVAFQVMLEKPESSMVLFKKKADSKTTSMRRIWKCPLLEREKGIF